VKDEEEVLRYDFKDYIKDLVSKSNEWKERAEPEPIQWPESDSFTPEDHEPTDQRTPEETLFQGFSFSLPEMSAILQSFDADAGAGLFGELVRGEEVERFWLMSETVVIAT